MKTSAPDGGERLTSHPGHFTTGKNPGTPLNRRLVGPESRSGHFGYGKKSLVLTGIQTRIIQPIA